MLARHFKISQLNTMLLLCMHCRYQQAADHVQIFIDQAKTKLCGKESELAQLQIHCILGYEVL